MNTFVVVSTLTGLKDARTAPFGARMLPMVAVKEGIFLNEVDFLTVADRRTDVRTYN